MADEPVVLDDATALDLLAERKLDQNRARSK